MFNKHPI